jgi:hypothetical protein
MALPDNALSSTPVASPLIAPDSDPRADFSEDYERAGVAVNDPTQGLDVKTWRGWTDGTSVFVAPLPTLSPVTTVVTGANITEVALSFDQNMEPTVAYVEGGMVKLRWYDSQAGSTVTTSWLGVRSPMLTLDDKRATAGSTSDIIFAYIRDGQARYRQQRDRYNVEYTLGPVPGPSSRLLRVGMGVNNRLQFKVSAPPSALHADLLTDTIYVLSAGSVVGLDTGTPQVAVWRSKTFQTDETPVMAWARLEGHYPLKFRLYADGAMVQVTEVASGEPFRLRSIRCKEWSVELEGSVRAQRVSMAQAADDLF